MRYSRLTPATHTTSRAVKRRWLSLTLALAAGASIAAAPSGGPQTTGQTFVAPYDTAGWWPYEPTDETCGLNLRCTASAEGRWTTGNADASAAIAATGVPTAASGMLSFAGARVSENYQLHGGWQTVTYTVTFDITSAHATATPGSAAEVRALVDVSHDRCGDCVVQLPPTCRDDGYCIVVAARQGLSTGEIASRSDTTFPVTVTLSRPDGGEIPKGRIEIDASLESVVSSFGPWFAGEVAADVDGTVAAIRADYVPVP